MGSRAVRVGLSIILAVALLAVFLANVDLAEVGRELGRAHAGMIVASVAAAMFSYWLRALRWQLILRPAGRVRHSSVLLATASGYAAMALLPARMGDLVRPLLLTRRERLPVSAALASVVTERIFDLWTVILFFLLFLIHPPSIPAAGATAQSNLQALATSGWFVGAGLVLGTAVLVALLRFQEPFIDGLTKPIGTLRPSWREPVAGFLRHFLDGLRVVSRPRDLAVTLSVSIAMWYVIFWQVQFSLWAFEIDLPLRASYLLVTLAVIGLAVPTPGGVGGFHAATKYGLTTFFGVPDAAAAGAAIVYHAVSFVPITLLGLACLPAFGVRLREVEDIASTPDDGSPTSTPQEGAEP